MKRSFISLLLGLCSTLVIAASLQTVAIDVGHYLAAPGTHSASGKTEFEFNKAIALQLAAQVKQHGITPTIIGAQGTMQVLTDRTASAQSQDVFVSIHHDSVQAQYLPEANRFKGYSIFVSKRNPYPAASLACAQQIAVALQAISERPSVHHHEAIPGENRPFADEALGVYWFDDLVVLRTAVQPALLVEIGVIVNPDEEHRLTQTKTQAKLAKAIATGLAHCDKTPR